MNGVTWLMPDAGINAKSAVGCAATVPPFPGLSFGHRILSLRSVLGPTITL
jgi:hypothetical protein